MEEDKYPPDLGAKRLRMPQVLFTVIHLERAAHEYLDGPENPERLDKLINEFEKQLGFLKNHKEELVRQEAEEVTRAAQAAEREAKVSKKIEEMIDGLDHLPGDRIE